MFRLFCAYKCLQEYQRNEEFRSDLTILVLFNKIEIWAKFSISQVILTAPRCLCFKNHTCAFFRNDHGLLLKLFPCIGNATVKINMYGLCTVDIHVWPMYCRCTCPAYCTVELRCRARRANCIVSHRILNIKLVNTKYIRKTTNTFRHMNLPWKVSVHRICHKFRSLTSSCRTKKKLLIRGSEPSILNQLLAILINEIR